MNKIKVMSRYNEPRYFEEIEEGYKFTGDFGFIRGGYLAENQAFVDVNGGPMIAVKTDLEEIHPDLKGIVNNITRIDNGYLIEVK